MKRSNQNGLFSWAFCRKLLVIALITFAAPLPASAAIAPPQCGTAQNTFLKTQPAGSSLCNTGSPIGVNALSGANKGAWQWWCLLEDTSQPTRVTSLTSCHTLASPSSPPWTIGAAPAAPVCGPDNHTYIKTAPATATLCNVGYQYGLTDIGHKGTGPWSWNCQDWNANISVKLIARCASLNAPAPVNGSCGSASGVAVTSAPTTNLCGTGTATSVAGTGPFTWSCTGSDGGTNASCSAPLKETIVNGSCGSANGTTVAAAPNTNLCTTGTASAVATNPSGFIWSCAGSTSGTTATCTATLSKATYVYDVSKNTGPQTVTLPTFRNGAETALVIGNGQTTVVINTGCSSIEYWDWAQNADGSITGQEHHCAGNKATLSGVTAIKFGNGDAQVKTTGLAWLHVGTNTCQYVGIDNATQNADNICLWGQYCATCVGSATPAPTPAPSPSPTPTPDPTPAPTPTPTTTGSFILPPALPATSDGLLGYQLQNIVGANQPGFVLTFGQFFKSGAVLPTDKLLAHLANGTDVPVQLDVKTTHTDGSVAHAILSAPMPALASGSTLNFVLAKGTLTTGATLTPQDILAAGYDLKLDLNLTNADGTKTLREIDAATLLHSALNDGSFKAWLQGPIASQFRISTPINANLTATFDIQINKDKTTHTDVIVANEKLYTPAAVFNYDVTIKQGGKVVYSKPGLSHYPLSNWHIRIDSDNVNTVSGVNLVRDVQYLIDSGALPSFDFGKGLADWRVNLDAQTASTTVFGPLAIGTVQQWMPGTGARDDIGLVPAWTGDYLAAQQPGALAWMLGNADVAGSVPWNCIDDATGTWVRVDQHPSLFIDYRNGNGGTEVLPGYDDNNRNNWTPDSAHVVELSYVPYLLTGSHYYLDELQAESSWHIGNTWSYFRDGSADAGQVRAIAWLLRDLANAAVLSPDGDPLKAYFIGQLNSYVGHLTTKYITNDAHPVATYGEVRGYVDGDNGPIGHVAPWQQNYLAASLGKIHDQGFTVVDPLLTWMDNFVSGIIVNMDKFYKASHPGRTQPYSFNARGGAQTTNPLLTTWAAAGEDTFGADSSDPNNNEGLSTPILGYNVNNGQFAQYVTGQFGDAVAGVAAEASVTHSALSMQAYKILRGEQVDLGQPDSVSPFWNFKPRP